MSKAVYTGVGGIARKVPKLYVGVNGVARKVKKGYVGVDGVARLFYSKSTKPSRLPEGYKELEYIYTDNTNGQYIDTGVKPDANTKLIIDAQFIGYRSFGDIADSHYSYTSSSNIKKEAYFQAYVASGYNIWCLIGFRYDVRTTGVVGQQIASGMTDRFQLVMKGDRTGSINGIAYDLRSSDLSDSDFNHIYHDKSRMPTIKLLQNAVIKMYSCEIYSGDTLTNNFIPCKNSVGLVGAYDLVTDKLYQSASGKPFLAGPEI